MFAKQLYEILIWSTCVNDCTFCYRRFNPKNVKQKERKQILNKAINFIDSESFVKGSDVLISGGEIFDKTLDMKITGLFFKHIVDRMNDNIIGTFYIDSNLIYDARNMLIDLMFLIQKYNLFNRFKFITCYDIEGRFVNNRNKHLMLFNLKWLKSTFPDLDITVNTILTKPACNAILDNCYNIKEFMKEYQCFVNLVPYIIRVESLTPSQDEVMNAIHKTISENEGYLNHYKELLNLEQSKLSYAYKDGEYSLCYDELNACKHKARFINYCDKESCFMCDFERLQTSL